MAGVCLVSVVLLGRAAASPLGESGFTAQPPPLERSVVEADGHPLTVWSRRPLSPRAAVLLVHGRTWSSLPDFDLQVPGLQRSVLTSLAARGFVSYAVDLRGYGATPRDPSGRLRPQRAADDVTAVVRWIGARHPDLAPPAVVGWSRGAAVAMLAAQQREIRISALVLFAFAFDPDARFVDAPASPMTMPPRNTAESASSDFISPRVTPPAVVRAFVAQALSADPLLVDLDGDSDFNRLDPRAVTVPTLLLLGERDPGVDEGAAAKMLSRIGARDKSLVVLDGADHAAQIEDTHEAWVAAVVSLVDRAIAKR